MTTIPLLIFELVQLIFLQGPYIYIRNGSNFIDVLAILSYLLFGCLEYIGSFNQNEELNVAIYSVAIVSGFICLYNNLKVVSAFRKFSHALWKIMVDIKAFLVIFTLMIFVASNIFYVSKFYNQRDTYPDDTEATYKDYVLWSYDYIFGTWTIGTPKNRNLEWIELFHVGYSFIFGVIMVNVLIAIVTNSFQVMIDKEKPLDTLLKVSLVIDSMELQYFYQKFIKRIRIFFRLNKKYDFRKDAKNINIYFIGLKPEPILSEDVKEILQIVNFIKEDTSKLDVLEEIEQIMCNVEEKTYEIEKFSSKVQKRTKKMQDTNEKFETESIKILKDVIKHIEKFQNDNKELLKQQKEFFSKQKSLSKKNLSIINYTPCSTIMKKDDNQKNIAENDLKIQQILLNPSIQNIVAQNEKKHKEKKLLKNNNPKKFKSNKDDHDSKSFSKNGSFSESENCLSVYENQNNQMSSMKDLINS